MKILLKFLFIAVIALQMNCLSGQTIITSRIFPTANDSLNYYVDTASYIGNKITLGANQVWDFTRLKINSRRLEVYRSPSLGIGKASFPNATVMQRNGIQERYYNATATAFQELGTYITTTPGGPFPLPTGPTVYPKPHKLQIAPYHYLDTFSSSFNTVFTVSKDVIPDTLLSQLPATFRPDSFRLKNVTSVKKAVVGWGSLKLPARIWDALLEESSSKTVSSIEAKVAFLGWIDITALAGPLLGNLFGDGLTTSNTYNFWSNDAKGYLASVTTDTLGLINTIQYKQNNWQVGTAEIDITHVTLDDNGKELLINSDRSIPDAAINIYDLSSKKIVDQPIHLDGKQSFKFDLKHGIYLVVLYQPATGILALKKIIR